MKMKQNRTNLVETLATGHPRKKDLERRIAELGLGIVVSLQNGEMSIEQAEGELFNLDNLQAIRKRRLSPQLVELFDWGMQLEDVAELAPANLPGNYRTMSRLAERVIQQSWRKGRARQPV
jgi:hypothetical protein